MPDVIFKVGDFTASAGPGVVSLGRVGFVPDGWDEPMNIEVVNPYRVQLSVPASNEGESVLPSD